MSRANRLLVIALAYPAWLLFQAVHEVGHVLHSVVSGGHVERVELPLLGFSRTVLADNPHPLLVAAGGAVWGSLLPLAFAPLMPRRWPGGRRAARAFAGLCFVGNGTYLAVGWTQPAGDAADLLRLGVPPWVLLTVGAVATAAGLWVWYDLSRRPPQASDRKREVASGGRWG
jgi:hypothetical protein